MKIYTRQGDQGQSRLPNGKPMSKSDPIFEALGELDLLSAHLGLAGALKPSFLDKLLKVQGELLVLGAHLGDSRQPSISETAATRLESEIDEMETQLPPLKNFILPGGCELAARLHVARGVCRSAERKLAALPPDNTTSAYLNRLSDWLFVAARFANHLASELEQRWTR
jgi:cob(I)alamin adenosyltransferase